MSRYGILAIFANSADGLGGYMNLIQQEWKN